MKHQVVITGIGLVTPVGNDTSSTWQALQEGRSGTSLMEHDTLRDYPYKHVGMIKQYQQQLDQVFSPKNQLRADRFIHFAMMAGHQAMMDAGLTREFPAQRDRFGTYLGIGIGGLETMSTMNSVMETKGPKSISPFAIPKAINNLAPNWLSMTWQLEGPSLAVSSACSSGADAVGLAFRCIRDGYADYMLAGGAEGCVIPITLVAFGNMRALSAWQGDAAHASRPFDAQRSGFVLAEGAGVVVLERKDLAEKRGANIYAQVVGYGATADAYHMTAMHPEGLGAVKAVQGALTDAGINTTNVGYINAHGTGTPMNDAVETMVLKKVFGSYVDPHNPHHLLVSSTKSMTGHMLGAAGGAEVGIAALALKHQLVPPTINLDNPDPACDLDYVAHHARQHTMTYALSNSFGFGGGNSVIALKKV